MNLEVFGPGERAPEVVNVAVEIPRGGSNKIEYRPEAGAFALDRVLFSPLYYPAEYGFIIGSLSEDGDPTDILVLSTFPTFTGCVLPARVVGALKTRDERGGDTKVLAVCDVDPRYDGVETLEQVPKHILQEIEQFFRTYKALENKSVEVDGWEGREAALDHVNACLERARSRPAPRS